MVSFMDLCAGRFGDERRAKKGGLLAGRLVEQQSPIVRRLDLRPARRLERLPALRSRRPYNHHIGMESVQNQEPRMEPQTKCVNLL